MIGAAQDTLDRLLARGVLARPGTRERLTQGDWDKLERTPEGVPLLLREGTEAYLAAVGSDWDCPLTPHGTRTPTGPGLSLAATLHLAHYSRQCVQDESPLRKAVSDLLRLSTTGHGPSGLAIELGSSVGADLPALGALAETVVAIDSYVVPLRWAAQRCMGQRPLIVERQGGHAFRTSRIPVDSAETQAGLGRVVTICGNALDPPFVAECADIVLALNVLDNVTAPLTLLGQIDALLKPGGLAVIGSPFHWQDTITALQRRPESVTGTSSGPDAVRALLGGKGPGMEQVSWELLEEREVDWVVRDHDRCAMTYRVWLMAAKKRVQP